MFRVDVWMEDTQSWYDLYTRTDIKDAFANLNTEVQHHPEDQYRIINTADDYVVCLFRVNPPKRKI